MFYAVDLTFHKSEILTKVMLDELRDFPQAVLFQHYHSYPDGIVAGTFIYEENEQIFIDKGIIKYHDRLYRMGERFNLSSFIKGQILENQTSYKLVLSEEKTSPIDDRNGQIKTTLEPKISLRSEEVSGITLAYFTLYNTAIKIPTLPEHPNEKNMEQYFKSAAFSMIHVGYCGNSGTTFHPFIFSGIKEILKQKENKSVEEFLILNEIIEKNYVEIELIETILQCHLKDNWESMEKMELAERRETILSQLVKYLFLKNGSMKGKPEAGDFRTRKESKMLPT